MMFYPTDYDKDGICYPVRGRQCSSQQLEFITTEFPNYETFAAASIDEVLGDRRKEHFFMKQRCLNPLLF